MDTYDNRFLVSQARITYKLNPEEAILVSNILAKHGKNTRPLNDFESKFIKNNNRKVKVDLLMDVPCYNEIKETLMTYRVERKAAKNAR